MSESTSTTERIELEKHGLEKGWSFFDQRAYTRFAHEKFTLHAFWSHDGRIVALDVARRGKKVAAVGYGDAPFASAWLWLSDPEKAMSTQPLFAPDEAAFPAVDRAVDQIVCRVSDALTSILGVVDPRSLERRVLAYADLLEGFEPSSMVGPVSVAARLRDIVAECAGVRP